MLNKLNHDAKVCKLQLEQSRLADQSEEVKMENNKLQQLVAKLVSQQVK